MKNPKQKFLDCQHIFMGDHIAVDGSLACARCGRSAKEVAADNCPLEELKRQCVSHGGQKNFAEAHGFSPQYICDLVNKKRRISRCILNALGLKEVVYYVRKK